MRHRYLVCYDVADPKRLRRVAKVVEEYGTRIQFSVFECPLDDLRLQQLKADLKPEINEDYDQILFVSLGPESTDASFRIEAMGLTYDERSRVTII